MWQIYYYFLIFQLQYQAGIDFSFLSGFVLINSDESSTRLLLEIA